MQDLRRWCAAGATATAGFGVAGLAVALWDADPAHYVSESGVPGASHATLYRASMWLLAATLLLLVAPAGRTAALVPSVLALGAAFAAVSGTVSCSPGCPLPPYERPTLSDLIHATGAIGALLLCGLAMLLYAMQPDGSALRRTGRVAVAVAFPVLGLAAIGILFAGRGLFTGVAERAALVPVSGWLIVTAAMHVRAKP